MQYATPMAAPKPKADPAASPTAPRVTKGRMIGLTSRKPSLKPRCVVMASGGNQSGQDAGAHLVLERPEWVLWLGRIGKCEAANLEALRLHCGAQ